MFYDGSLPEAHNNEKPTEEHLHVTKRAPKWPWIVMALILAAAIAVGVSVGVWHHRKQSLHKAPITSRCGICTDRISSWLTFIARRRRKIRNPHRILISPKLLNSSLMTHLWQLYHSPMATGIYFSRIILVSSDVRSELRPTANGPRVRISMPVRLILSPILARTPRNVHR